MYDQYIGKRVVLRTRSGWVYGASGSLHISRIESGHVFLATEKGVEAAGVPLRDIRKVFLFRESAA